MVDLPPGDDYDPTQYPAWYQSQTGAWIHYEDLMANHRLVDKLMPAERVKFEAAQLGLKEGK